MNYTNEKLNITIENAEYFEIVEKDCLIKLYFEQVLKYVVYANSTVRAYDNSIVKAYDNSTVEAFGNSTVYANDNSTVRAYDNSTVYTYDNSTVRAYDNSTVYAYGNSTVYAYEFSCIHQLSIRAKIKANNHFGAVIGQVFKLKEGITVYKKLRDNKIAVLKLEKGQVFQSENHNKCRTDWAFVERVESIDGKEQFANGFSMYDSNFVYEVGKTVSSEYDENIDECSSGIHFFLTREKAEEYR